MFILLPLSDKGLPKDLEEKKEVIHTVLKRAYSFGFTKEDVIIDGLVATVGANKKAAIETLETIRYCTEQLGICTVCGLSNISFGLPERSYVNSAFLTMAIANGLTMAIANPSQQLLMNLAFATDLLMNKEESDIRYIDRMSRLSKEEEEEKGQKLDSTMPKVYECVVKGNKSSIINEVKEELALGRQAGEIINEFLIPAINQVGVLFEQQKYFLPQLISSAETMKTAIEYLEPMLEKKENGDAMPTIVMATVEGDIHDIGKNLVVLMLKNYGFHVIDLGKDVSKEKILETAIAEKADIIGLSALMTTTMMRMKDVVEYRNQLGVDVKIIIGGAVITNSFAKEIGADGYSKDAAEAVKLVQKLMDISS
ncbi:MAG: cobalamin-dependent protein, partial [Clostridiales bacterium]|nr:cobalamin-dependent protein [Clostridiales bacterium]